MVLLLGVLRIISMLHGSQAKAGWADCYSIRMILLEICNPDRVNADDRRTVMLPSTVPRGSTQAEEATLPHQPPKIPSPTTAPAHPPPPIKVPPPVPTPAAVARWGSFRRHVRRLPHSPRPFFSSQRLRWLMRRESARTPAGHAR